MNTIDKLEKDLLSNSDDSSMMTTNPNITSIPALDEKDYPWFSKLDWNDDERYR